MRGARNSHVATLVERHSRFCMLVKVPGKDTATAVLKGAKNPEASKRLIEFLASEKANPTVEKTGMKRPR